jgi:malate/lactate dehydrogenase
VFYDKKTVYTVSHPLNGRFGIKDVSLSLPAVIGAKGLIREVDLNLSALEKKQLRQSANKLKVAEKSLKS